MTKIVFCCVSMKCTPDPESYFFTCWQNKNSRLLFQVFGLMMSFVCLLLMQEFSLAHVVAPPAQPTSPVDEHVRAIKEGFDKQLESGASAATVSSAGEDAETNVHLSPFHRAKKHLKNFVSGECVFCRVL